MTHVAARVCTPIVVSLTTGRREVQMANQGGKVVLQAPELHVDGRPAGRS